MIVYNKVSWESIAAHVLTLGKHEKYFIRKSEVMPLPNYAVPRLGLPLRRHFNISVNDGRAIHVEDYSDYYRVHWDEVDPIKNPIGHFRKDASITDKLVITAIGLGVVDHVFFGGKYRRIILGSGS